MDFKDILKMDIRKEEIALGIKGNDLFKIDINEFPSLIITGETGSGKSILLDQVLLQFIKKYTSLELGIMAIDTSGVELNYYKDTEYSLFSAINDEEKSIVALSRVLKEIERRKNLLASYNVMTVEEHNKVAFTKLPLIVVAIDDDKLLLRNPDMEKMLLGIISQLKGLGIFFVLATSDVHNKFFETDKNVFASVRLTFDYTNPTESRKANIEGADALSIGEFKVQYQDKEEIYNNFEFDDKIIEEIVSR